MSKICLIFAANASESDVTACLQALATDKLFFLTDYSNSKMTHSSYPDLNESLKRVGALYFTETNEKYEGVDAFSFGKTQEAIKRPEKLSFAPSRLVVYLDVNLPDQRLDTLLHQDPNFPLAPATKKKITQEIMQNVTATKVLQCQSADDLKTNLDNIPLFDWSFKQPEITTKEVPTQPVLDEEKCKKAIELLKKQCERYQIHLDKMITELQRKKQNLEQKHKVMPDTPLTQAHIPEAQERTAKKIRMGYQISKLESKIKNAAKKKEALTNLIKFDENSLASQQLIIFQKNFAAFSEQFKPIGEVMAARKADAKFKRRVALAFVSVGITALVRGYRLGTFQFWKSHKEVLAKKAAAIEKELPTKPIKPKKQ